MHTFRKTTVRDLAFSPDDKWVVSTYGNLLLVWDVATGKELLSQDAKDTIFNVALSADGERLAFTGFKNVRVWSLKAERTK